jgi:hypothetical protein
MTIEGLQTGYDPDWGWWVSPDFVHRVYSSFSLDDALVNWRSSSCSDCGASTEDGGLCAGCRSNELVRSGVR